MKGASPTNEMKKANPLTTTKPRHFTVPLLWRDNVLYVTLYLMAMYLFALKRII